MINMNENYMDENELLEFVNAVEKISQDDGSSPDQELKP